MRQEHLKNLLLKYRNLLKDRYYRWAVIIGIVALIASGLIISATKNYVNQATGNPLGDVLLDNLPTFPMINFLIWGIITIVVSIFIFALFHPEYFPALFKSFALLFFIRAVFISVTHIKSYPTKEIANIDYPRLVNFLYNGDDLFFSGHVALPFLAMLIFWNYKWFRSYLLIAVLASAVAVILAKSHYSIDVLAAPFITYTIYHIAQHFFKKDFGYIRSFDARD